MIRGTISSKFMHPETALAHPVKDDIPPRRMIELEGVLAGHVVRSRVLSVALSGVLSAISERRLSARTATLTQGPPNVSTLTDR
jgi:hypothetical protein